MEIFKKGSLSFLYNGLGAFLGVLIQFIAAKYLESVEFGKYNYFIGLANSIALFFSFGISFYFPKIFQREIDKKKVFSEVFFTLTVIFLLLFPLIVFFIEFDFSRKFDFFLLLIATFLIINIGYYRAFLIAEDKAIISSKLNNFVLRIIVLFLFICFLFFMNTSSYSLIYATIIAHFIIVVPFLKNKVKRVKPSISFFKGSYIFYLIQLLYGFFNEYTKVIQADYFSFEAVSYLSIALLVGQTLVIFGQNFANVSMPIFAKAFLNKDIKLMNLTFQTVARINAFFLIPVFLILLFNSELVLSLIGKEYIAGAPLLKFILIGAFIGSFVGPNGTVLLMTNKSIYELLNGFIKIFIIICLIIFFGRDYIWGLAMSIAVSEVIVNLLKSIEVYYLYKIIPFSKRTAIFICVFFILEAIIFYLISFYINSLIFSIVLNIIFFLGFLLISFIYSPDDEDRKMVLKLIKSN